MLSMQNKETHFIMDREKKIPITEKMLTFENVGIEKLVWPR